MNLTITFLIALAIGLSTVAGAPQLKQQQQRNDKQVQTEDELPAKGATIEEVVVESALFIKPKARQQVRRVRALPNAIYTTHKRVKRQRGKHNFGSNSQVASRAGNTQANINVGAGNRGSNADAGVQFGPVGPLGPHEYRQEQAAANGAANSQYNNGLSSGSSAGIAQAQGFQSQSGNNGFGAASSSTATQSQNINPFGNSNSAGASHSQVYKLPNGQTINFSATNTFANGGFGNNANSRGGAVSVSG